MIALLGVAYLVVAVCLAVALGNRLEQLHRAQTRRDFYRARVDRDP